MKRYFLTILAALLAWTSACMAQTVRFMPQWTPQAQFAGFYMAQEKGFYADAGLNVDFHNLTVTSTGNAMNFLEQGEVDFCTLQLAQAVIGRSEGRKMVCVLQISQNTGLMCVSNTPLSSVTDLAGKRVGRWKSGFSEIAQAALADNGVKVRWVPFIQSINLFVSGAVDATLCYSYSEYIQLLLSKGSIPEENVLRFSREGYNYPEDGLYVMEDYYRTHKAEIEKFVAATRLGWEYAAAHEEETIDVVMDYAHDAGIATNRVFQKLMLEEFVRLATNPRTGKMDFEPVGKETFDVLNLELQRMGFIEGLVSHRDMIR